MTRLLSALLLLALALAPAAGADDKDAGYKPLFNGRDLTGWARVNTAPGTFFVKDGEIITTGKPYGYLRTDRQYENFVAEFEWMHVNKTEVGNSGFFVWGDALPVVGSPFTRGIEVQVLVNLEYKDRNGAITATSHGDVFSIQGATCKPDRPHPGGWARCLPSEHRAKGGGEWNHYKIVANDGAIKLHVNGKEVSGVSQCRPRKGYLALESEGAECHFRNLKIKELPSTNPKPDEAADEDKGFRSLFTGLDLSGWKTEDGAWKVNDGHLRATGKADLVTQKAYDKYDLLFDCKIPANFRGEWSVGGGGYGEFRLANIDLPNRGKWNRVIVTVGKDGNAYSVNGEHQAKSSVVPRPGPISFKPAEGMELMNLFLRESK
jgi:Domain of Unknown Function (DUF1080)